MDTTQLTAVPTLRTRCLLQVHPAPLSDLAARHDLPILEDCVLAHGARRDGGRATINSSDEVARQLRIPWYYGKADRYYVVQTPGRTLIACPRAMVTGLPAVEPG